MSARLEDAFWGMVLMGMASFFNDLTMPPSWNTCMDIAESTAGTVAGSMNMMGNSRRSPRPHSADSCSIARTEIGIRFST